MESVYANRRSTLPYRAPKDYCPPFPIDVVGSYSNHGIEPANMKGKPAVKINQDRAGVEYPFLSVNLATFAVFDGHGNDGECCSDLAMNCCIKEIEKGLAGTGFADGNDFELSLLEQVFTPAFEKVHLSLVSQNDFDAINSGTTATVVLLGCSEPSWVAVASAGDSVCVCGRENQDGAWSAIELTANHKPCEPYELKRIAEAGGVVKKLSGNDHAHVWTPNYQSALAMSRSLGDATFHDIGVITTPHVSFLEVTPADKFLIVASDGVSEFITSEEMVFLVSQYENATDACIELVHEAMLRWSKAEGAYRDDITCTVVMLPDALVYMKSEGASEAFTNKSNATALVEVAPSEELALNISKRSRFTRRRSVICAKMQDMSKGAAAEAEASEQAALRDTMPEAVMRERRCSLTISPDMDAGLDQIGVSPPTAEFADDL